VLWWNVVIVWLCDGEEIGGVMLELWQDRASGNVRMIVPLTADTYI
jgi:hypothetical protein